MFLVLALVAVGWAQLFGMKWGYLAEVDGRVVQTFASHHHEGDHLESGHFVSFLPHDHTEDHHAGHDHGRDYGHGDCGSAVVETSCCGDGPVQEHRPLELSFEMLKARDIHLSLPVFVILDSWQWFDAQERLMLRSQSKVLVPKPPPLEDVPLLSVDIASCMVLLV